MTICYVASTAEDDTAAVYEYIDGRVSLVNNRSFNEGASNDSEAFTIVEGHASKFLPPRRPITSIRKMDLDIGAFYPSIARPIYPSKRLRLKNPNFEVEATVIARIKREIGLIAYDLEQCFDVVSPEEKNSNVFGTTFETIINFACVGIETLFSKIIFDNKISLRRRTTNDFVKLNAFLKLNEYEATMARYP